jgi:hypothetical protein
VSASRVFAVTPKRRHAGSNYEPKMMARLNLLPEPAFVDLKPILGERLQRIAADINVEQYSSLLDPLMREVLTHGFAEAGAHEGTVWLVDAAGEYLVPAYNSGPNAALLVGKFRQPLGAGLICMVFASEQPFVENEVHKNPNANPLLDTLLHVQTCALIGVPFSFLQRCRGVISCVRLRQGDEQQALPDGFRPADLIAVQRAASVLARLIEYRLLCSAVDWSHS